jgi:hypothetical protein
MLPAKLKYLPSLLAAFALLIVFAVWIRSARWPGPLWSKDRIHMIAFIASHRSEVDKELPRGITKEKVAELLGKPDNTDPETVWIWSKTERKGRWVDLFPAGGFFVVFVDNCLVSPVLKTTESNPQEVLKECFGYTPNAELQIAELLGNQ